MEDDIVARPMTDQQVSIFNFLLLHTWTESMAEFNIKSKSIFRTIVMRTALGLEWFPEHPGGPRPYLNFEKEQRLVSMIEKASETHESAAICEVTALAACLKRETMIDAIASLNKRRCKGLADKLADEVVLEPSHGWIYSFIQRNKLHTALGRGIEAVRTFSRSRLRICSFFLKFLPLFNRDPRLIFGADETDMKPSSRFKVVCPEGQQGFVTDTDTGQKHITAMCAHSAGGAAAPPLLLLSNIKKLPRELAIPEINSNNICWFATTERGYMTERAFNIWSHMFVAWLSGYRAVVLPDDIKKANILLVMDGCHVHHCPEALRLFAANNVTVLLLPSHTTHLLQPFDVLIASSLKNHFRRFLFEEKKALPTQGADMSKAARSRIVLVKAFLRAWSIAASPSMCTRSFEVVGFYPICPSRVLQSPFVSSGGSDCDMDWSRSILTNEEVIRHFESNLRRAPMKFASIGSSPDDYQRVIEDLMNDCPAGRLLSLPPPTYACPYGVWFIWKSFSQNSVPVMNQASIYNMMRQLTAVISNEGDDIIRTYAREQEQAHQNVEATVIREAALHFAHEIAANMVHGSLRVEADQLLSADFRERLKQHLLESVQSSDVDETTKATLTAAISTCAQLTVQGIRELLDF